MSTMKCVRRTYQQRYIDTSCRLDHARTKVKRPHPKAICERFQKTILEAIHQAAPRRKISTSLAELQADLDEGLDGWTPYATLTESLQLATAKQISNRAYSHGAAEVPVRASGDFRESTPTPLHARSIISIETLPF